MKRRLPDILAGLSVLLCVATVALWIRGAGTADVMRWKRVAPLEEPPILEETFYLAFASNAVRVYHFKVLQNYGARSEGGIRLRSRSIPSPRPAGYLDGFERVTVRHELLGFAYREGGRPGRLKGGRMIAGPYWFLVLATALPPALRLRAVLRRRGRGMAGFCLHCGYDCRATPDRCPECGAGADVATEQEP